MSAFTTQKNRADDKEFLEHTVFGDIQTYVDFYEQFSYSIMNFPTMGTRSIVNIDTYIYLSIQGTLESIQHILKNGRVGDAYALLRKYHDSVITNIYTNLYLEDNYGSENFIVQQIANWIQGAEKIPEYRKMMQYVKNSEKLKAITDLLDHDNRYKELKDRCEDHLHYNFFRNFMVNDNQVYIKNRVTSLNSLQNDVADIFVLHLSCIFYLKDHYMISSDYLDALEVGMQPEENSHYWVAPFIQDIFSNVIAKKRPDVAKAILDATSMQLAK
jgi:hypothetical protein